MVSRQKLWVYQEEQIDSGRSGAVQSGFLRPELLASLAQAPPLENGNSSRDADAQKWLFWIPYLLSKMAVPPKLCTLRNSDSTYGMHA